MTGAAFPTVNAPSLQKLHPKGSDKAEAPVTPVDGRAAPGAAHDRGAVATLHIGGLQLFAYPGGEVTIFTEDGCVPLSARQAAALWTFGDLIS